MGILSTSVLLILAFTIWYLSALPSNYRAAKNSGLPIRFGLWGSANPLWLIICTIVGYSNLSRVFPQFIFDRIKITIPAWEHYCKHFVHEKWGTTFILVTPGRNTVFVGDAEVAEEALTRRKDFGKNEIALRVMDVWGPNISASEGEDWQRHRRIVAPALNERIMKEVWNESLTQTQDMISTLSKSTMKNESSSTNVTFEGLRTITINYMPAAVQKMGISKAEFPLHLNQSIAEERRSPSSRNSLLNSLVKIADQSTGSLRSKTSTYLSNEDVTGNLFAMTVGGFDTTANTLSYALMCLALYPELQSWVIAEIDEVEKLHPDSEYSTTFPLLTRSLAMMYETLRLYTLVPTIARRTTQAQTIKNINFAPETEVLLNTTVIHTLPSIWGTDSLDYRPSRWIETSPTSKKETLREPPKGTFLAWSHGPRYCPGMKMSQVEFVGVLYEIFRKWNIEIVRRDGETEEDARRRLMEILEDSSPKLTLQVNRPQDVVFKYLRRKLWQLFDKAEIGENISTAALSQEVPPANPNEKNILYKILKLLKLNIQLIFVADGSHRPKEKYGGQSPWYKYLSQDDRLLKKMATSLGVIWHEAPGEAEAECAALQSHKIQEQFPGLTRDGLVLFAVLKGGDYSKDGKSLTNCGASLALQIATAKEGFGKDLCNVSHADFSIWRNRLREHLTSINKRIDVPDNFPDPRTVGLYNKPLVSSEKITSDIGKFWNPSFDEMELQRFIAPIFNFWVAEYIKYIIPILLVRSLASTQPGQEASNNCYKLNDITKKKSPVLQKNVEVLLSAVTLMDLQAWRDEFTNKGRSGKVAPVTEMVKCEDLLACIIEHGTKQALPPAAPSFGRNKTVVSLETISKGKKRAGSPVAPINTFSSPHQQLLPKRAKFISEQIPKPRPTTKASIEPAPAHSEVSHQAQNISSSTKENTMHKSPERDRNPRHPQLRDTNKSSVTTIDLTLDDSSDEDNQVTNTNAQSHLYPNLVTKLTTGYRS
ncbi:cytochrome p450 [Botrytis cinerea]